MEGELLFPSRELVVRVEVEEELRCDNLGLLRKELYANFVEEGKRKP